MTDIAPNDRDMVKGLVRVVCPDAVIYIFGSRAKNGQARKSSDLDLVLREAQKLPFESVNDIKALMKASRLPFSVDVVDWHSLSAGFQAEIQDDLVEL
ncbi:MAG: nucleotidyltransferase family protein [Bdellovibrionales bacterium]